MDFGFEIFLHADAWISLITLTFLEIVLGVDNIIFISIVANTLPKSRQKQARNMGLMIALLFRIGLLLSISYIIRMTAPLFSLWGQDFSGRDLILIAGGLFLLAKSTTEIHHKVERNDEHIEDKPKRGMFWQVILQIVFLDIIFSFDSILTAVGLTQHVMVMILAVILAMIVMMLFSGKVSALINKYPTLQILALSFLIMIGLTLILEGFEVHINKGFVYSAVLFSLIVEMLNIRFRKKSGTK